MMEASMTTAEILRRPYARTLIPEEDGRFTAGIMEFPGCVAFGDDASSALEALEGVAVDWLEAALEQGQDIPAPAADAEYSGRLVLRLSKSLHRRAAACARQEGVSLNSFITTSLAETVGMKAARTTVTPEPKSASVRALKTATPRA